jgi:hypothetical protein
MSTHSNHCSKQARTVPKHLALIVTLLQNWIAAPDERAEEHTRTELRNMKGAAAGNPKIRSKIP